MTDARKARAAKTLLGSGAVALGGSGIVVDGMAIAAGNPVSTYLPTVFMFGYVVYYGAKQLLQRNKPLETQLPDLASPKFLQSPCGKALTSAGFLPSVDQELDTAGREILKEFLRVTEPIQQDIQLQRMSDEVTQESLAAINWHAREATKRLREHEQDQQILEDERARGTIRGSGYITPLE